MGFLKWLWKDIVKTLNNNQGVFDWGSVVGALIGAGGGLLNSSMNQSNQQQGYDIYQPEEYPWATGTQQSTNQYLMDMLNAMSRGGETPAWMNYLNPVQEGMQQDLANQFYGTAGRQGILNAQLNAASLGGIGPRAMMSKAQQASADYMSEGNKIDQYISGLKYNTMANQSLQVPQMLANMPRTAPYDIVNFMGGTSQGAGGQVGNMNYPNFGNTVGTAVNDWLTSSPSQYSTGINWLSNPSQYGGYYNQNIQNMGYGAGYPSSATWSPTK